MDWKEVSEDRSARRGRLAFDDQAESERNQTAPSLIVKIRESFGIHAPLETLPYRTPPYVANVWSCTGLRLSWLSLIHI
eukprot:11966699-Ditylum_brightwellii.AAC.1